MLPVTRNNSTLAPVFGEPANRIASIFDRLANDETWFAGAWAALPLSMWHDEDHIYVEADVPGMTDKEIDITVQDGVLYLRGERKPAERRNYVYNGRAFGRFERAVALPETVAADQVQAELSNGVLSVRLPKSPEAKPRKISIKTC
jgi:HSP20 family protein